MEKPQEYEDKICEICGEFFEVLSSESDDYCEDCQEEQDKFNRCEGKGN